MHKLAPLVETHEVVAGRLVRVRVRVKVRVRVRVWIRVYWPLLAWLGLGLGFRFGVRVRVVAARLPVGLVSLQPRARGILQEE